MQGTPKRWLLEPTLGKCGEPKSNSSEGSSDSNDSSLAFPLLCLSSSSSRSVVLWLGLTSTETSHPAVVLADDVVGPTGLARLCFCCFAVRKAMIGPGGKGPASFFEAPVDRRWPAFVVGIPKLT